MNLGRLPLERKTGEEPFRDGEREFDLRLVDYWRWSASDLVSNAQRGTLAEFLVAHALGVDGGVRTEWDAEANTSSGTPVRSADAYVFAVHAHREQESINPLDLSQWEFHVLSTARIQQECGDQKTLSLGALERLSSGHRVGGRAEQLSQDPRFRHVSPKRVGMPKGDFHLLGRVLYC